jgi:hypothetical protein
VLHEDSTWISRSDGMVIRTFTAIRSAKSFKGQLDLERHGGRSTAGVIARVLQRILALTTAIWCNDKLGLPIHRSLTAYDH